MSHDYSEYAEAPTESGFENLDVLIDLQRTTEAEVSDLEDKLRAARARLKDVAERQLPDLMDEMHLEEFKTKNGFKIKIKKTLRVSVAGDKMTPAIQWLVEHDQGDIIKRSVTIPFRVNQSAEASELCTELRERFRTVAEDAKVETSTLASRLRKLMEKGVDIPLEKFGAYEQRVAKLSV